MCALRDSRRHRTDLLAHRAAHIQHMRKVMAQMNIQLAQVLDDITGETGWRLCGPLWQENVTA